MVDKTIYFFQTKKREESRLLEISQKDELKRSMESQTRIKLTISKDSVALNKLISSHKKSIEDGDANSNLLYDREEIEREDLQERIGSNSSELQSAVETQSKLQSQIIAMELHLNQVQSSVQSKLQLIEIEELEYELNVELSLAEIEETF
jgi:hypothetical protein